MQETIDTLGLERTMRTRFNVLRDLVSDHQSELQHSSRSPLHRQVIFNELQVLRTMKARYETLVSMASQMSAEAIDNLEG